MTAAHCVHEKRAVKGLSNTQIRVLLGAHDLGDPHEPEKRTLRVEKIVIHPTWNTAVTSKYTGDIAVLVMENSVTFDDFIRPICLSQKLPSIEHGTVAGWGRRENQTIGISNELPRKIEIPIIDDKVCYEHEPLLARAGWTESFCAGREGVSVCDGDSGSGLHVKWNNKYYLRGIVSSAVLHEDCVHGYYAIYTDTTKYVSFIKAIDE